MMLCICKKLNKKFTKFAFWADQQIRAKSYTDIPAGLPWNIFQGCAYSHFVLSIVLVIMGMTCFIFGVQNSYMYSEINCGDGSNIAIPAVNLIIAFIGIVAMKQPHFSWHAFVHHVLTIVAVVFNIFAIIDLSLMAGRWTSWSASPRTPANWPHHFIVMDSVFVGVFIVNELICLAMLYIQAVYFRDYVHTCRHGLRRPSTRLSNNSTDSSSDRAQIVPVSNP